MSAAVVPLSDLRQRRQERAADAVLQVYAQALGKQLVRRELTPAEQRRREARRARARLRSSS